MAVVRTWHRSDRRAACVVAAALLPVVATVASAAPLALRDVCDESTELTLVGVDTDSRTVLLSMPSRQEAIPGWLLELGEAHASLHPEADATARFGGSSGPGPVLVLQRCGPACVQPAEWSRGRWRRVGGPFETAAGALLHTARDGSGTPWIVQQLPGSRAAGRRTLVSRLQENRWVEAGSLDATGAGSPAAVPDPDDQEALISGSVRFAVGRRPERWLRLVPDLGEGVHGILVPLSGGWAAYLASDSRLLLTRDEGGHWHEQRWTPWPGQDGVIRWGRGEHFWIDLPSGTASGPLSLLWFDDRPGHDPALWLSGGTAPDELVVSTVPRSPGPDGPSIEQAIHWGGGDWSLLAGCRRDERTAYVLVRTPRGADAGAWRRLPLRPGW